MAMSETSLQQLYLAYFGRPADFNGLSYYTTHPTLTEWHVTEQFSTSVESQNLYGSTFSPAVIVAIYQNLFNRDPDLEGLNYWYSQVVTGQVSAANAALAILRGAKNEDITAINNKLAVSAAFTAGLDTVGEIVGYSGDAAAATARAFLATVTSDPATLTAAMSGLDAAIAATVGSGGVIGDTVTLTDEQDEVEFTGTTIDTVKAFVDGTNDTLTAGDTISGNGKTILSIVVDASGTAPFVEMSGVDAIKVVAADSVSYDMDASTYGTDISTIELSGADGFDLDVSNLEVEGSIEVSIGASSASDIAITGTADGVAITIDLTNDDTDGVGAMATVGSAGINVTLGEDDQALLDYTSWKNDDATVANGNLTLGGVNMVIGNDAAAELYVSNGAYNSGTAGSATVGSLTIGDVSMDIGTDATGELYVYNSATADAGAATVGNLTIGNIDLEVAAGGSNSYLSVYNSADSTNGAATAGNITIGSVVSNAATSADSALYMYVYNYAFATTKGAATVGNTAVGPITVTAGDDVDYATAFFSQSAASDKGDATAGNIGIANVSMTVGNEVSVTTANVNFSVYNYANVGTSGAATVGAIAIGDVHLAAGSNADASFYVTNSADTAKGAATVGAVTIGNVSGVVGLGGQWTGYVDASAEGTAADAVGNLSIGNIDLYGEADADVNFSVDVSADNGNVGTVTIGAVDMQVDNDGSVSFDLYVEGNNVGAVTVGDVNLTLGSGASIDTFSISVSADVGDVASFTLGNVTIVGAKDSYDGTQGIDVVAADDIGDITLGNLSVTAGANAQFTSSTWDFTATAGDIGNVTIGTTTLTAAASANNWHYVNLTADGEIADVVMGDVNLSAAKNASAWLSVDLAASDDIGNIAQGDVTLTASAAGAYAGYSISADANGNVIGTIDVGDVTIDSKGAGAAATFFLYANDTGDTVGTTTVGDINLTVSNTAAGTTGAWAMVTADVEGNLVVGDISVTAGAVTEDFVLSATVDASVNLTTSGNLTVGDIVVAGGGSITVAASGTAASYTTALDGFGNLSDWLNLSETGSGSITIGNVDYRDYEGAATIDVSSYKGAGFVWASAAGSTITDNVTKNVITLGAGKDTVNLLEGATTTDSDATAIDEIIGFATTKDKIAVNTTSGGSSFAFVSSTATNYAAFLTAAGNAMANEGYDIYARKVGTDVYVAFDKDNGGAVDFVIKLTGVSTVEAADFVIS